MIQSVENDLTLHCLIHILDVLLEAVSAVLVRLIVVHFVSKLKGKDYKMESLSLTDFPTLVNLHS